MTIAQRLLRWYDAHGRALPWRHTQDPYRILVSEIMLQQTQVSRGLLFYDKWLKRFPDWTSLARATNAQVIRAWAGLGYNRRALMLRDIARQIVHQGDQVPKTREEWLALKGIGPYTSAAIAAFASHQRELPIDTNIRRVLGRLLLGIPYPQPSVDDRLRRSTDRILPKRGRFYDVPQALFDLATMICTKTPTCATCPLRTDCPAAKKFLSGRVRTPKTMSKKSTESRHRDKPHPDRIFRGRILREARNEISIKELGARIDPQFDPTQDTDWLMAMITRMERDGLVRRSGGVLMLG